MIPAQVPRSMAKLPGRVVINLDPWPAQRRKRVTPVTYAETAERWRANAAKVDRELKRQRDRDSYARRRDDILARRKAKREREG